MRHRHALPTLAAAAVLGLWVCLLWACGSGSSPDGGSDGVDGGVPDGTATGFDAPGNVTDGTPSVDGSGGATTSCGTGPGMSDCANGAESCCTSLAVAGGTFFRSYTNSADGGLMFSANPATVGAFRLDKYEVTVGRYRQFVKAWDEGKGYVPPPGSGKHTHLNAGKGLADTADAGTFEPGWIAADDVQIAPTEAHLSCDATATYPTWTPTPGAHESLPINCVSWYEAAAFCIWDGGFLPSSWEFEYAYAGGSAQRYYPWGVTAPGTNNDHAIYGCLFPSGQPPCVGVSNFAPVGTAQLGAGLWGQLDLAGSVLEWSLDEAPAPYALPCTDCGAFAGSTSRSIGGGSAIDAQVFLKALLISTSPDLRRNSIGFRCARTP
jgi:formylglycine-generating enzyme required for sulfatase activity